MLEPVYTIARTGDVVAITDIRGRQMESVSLDAYKTMLWRIRLICKDSSWPRTVEHTGYYDMRVDRLTAREIALMMAAVSGGADPETVCFKIASLCQEERWWLYDYCTQDNWRRAVACILGQ